MLPVNQGKKYDGTISGRESISKLKSEEKVQKIDKEQMKQSSEDMKPKQIKQVEQQMSFTQKEDPKLTKHNNKIQKTDVKNKGNLVICEPETPEQNELSEQDQLLNEQRQLSSIASFGQIQHNHNNTMSKYNGHFQNVSQFGDKNESLSSFKQVSGDRGELLKQEHTNDNPIHLEFNSSQKQEYLDDAQASFDLSEQKKHSSINSLGFNESAQNINNESNQFNSGAFQKSGYQISPSRQKANFLGEKIRMTHQQMQQQNQEGSMDLSSILIDQSNIFGGINEQTQNLSSLVADLSAPQSNSFDQKNLHFQLNLDQKN